MQCDKLFKGSQWNKTIKLAIFILQKGDVDGFKLLKTAEIPFLKKCSHNTNLKNKSISIIFFLNLRINS